MTNGLGRPKNYAPIAIFAYNRPEHTRRLLRSLKTNPETLYSPVVVYLDGLKRPEHSDMWEKTKAVIGEESPAHAIFRESEKNRGLAASLIRGITELTDQYGEVIVLEDDLVLSPTCLRYLNQGLRAYEDVDKVMHISAYMFPVKTDLPELFFYSEVTCWGWATWKRAWQKFNANANELISQINGRNIQYEFDNRNTMGFLNMLKAQSEGKIDSWAVRWYASMYLAGGLALHPGKSLVRNEGFDGTGVHCSATDEFEVSLNSTIFTRFPRQFELNETAAAAMRDYRSHCDARRAGLRARVWNKLKERFI